MIKEVKVKIGNTEVPIEVEIPDNEIVEDFNQFISSKRALKLLLNKWELKTKDDGINLENLKCVTKLKTDLSLNDRGQTSVFSKGEVDLEKAIAKFDMKLLKVAFNLGFDTIYFFEKDYPCVCVADEGNDIMVIAPRVMEK